MDLSSHHGNCISSISTCALTGPNIPATLQTSAPSPLDELQDLSRVQLDWIDDCESRQGRDHEVYVELQNEPSSELNEIHSLSEAPMKQPKTKAAIGLLSTLIAYVSINSWIKTNYPELFIWSPEDREEAEWVATSKSWLDRKACRWLGVCGVAHMHFTRQRMGPQVQAAYLESDGVADKESDWQSAWTDSSNRPEDWTDDEQVLREIPRYVLEYAPLVHLFSGEQYWPCDIAEHLNHITPQLNYTPIQAASDHASLQDLDQYNKYQRGRWVFLTSNDDVEDHPDWLRGEKNIPSVPDNSESDFVDNEGWIHHPGRTYYQGLKDAIGNMKERVGAGHGMDNKDDLKASATALNAHARVQEILEQEEEHHWELKRDQEVSNQQHRIRGGRSDAPAVLIAIDKGHGIVDAFWFFFYSFNLGNTVFNVRFGNHVGDWEHTAIRFQDGNPTAVFFSEHNFGSAYSYEAVEKFGKRPVIYSAVGTHAMYATPGAHPYVLPWGILHDQTDRGPLWDPALNAHAFTYDYKKDVLRSSNITPHAPTGWFHFAGHWGDKFYALSDKRQYRFAGQYHYVNGPLGPKFKNLGRQKICGGPDTEPCVIKHWLGGESKTRRLQLYGEEADLYAAEAEHLGVHR